MDSKGNNNSDNSAKRKIPPMNKSIAITLHIRMIIYSFLYPREVYKMTFLSKKER